MFPLYTAKEFSTSKSGTLLPLKCRHCLNTFYITKGAIQAFLAGNTTKTREFCSTKCQRAHEHPPAIVNCDQCNKSFKKLPSQIKQSKHNFCGHSCSAKYTNAHKTKGTRVSKLEKWLAEQLIFLFPELEFHFNRKDAINGELDIYIPSLRLAFELNGIFHYEPIYGSNKLSSIQTNDHRKMQACIEQSIELCIIDVSTISYFKPAKAQKFLDITANIINSKIMVSPAGIEPA